MQLRVELSYKCFGPAFIGTSIGTTKQPVKVQNFHKTNAYHRETHPITLIQHNLYLNSL